MKKNIFKFMTVVLASSFAFASCDLTETQKSSADVAMIFGSETGLQTYCYSFYNFLPSGSNAYSQDEMADYLAKTSLERYEMGSETPETAGSWDWTSIRKVNYFLDHNNYSSVPETIRNNYSGVARFFRAYLYYSKLVDYGEVPWIGRVLNPGDPELTAPRDSRDVIIRHIMDDCDFAFNNILLDNSSSCRANFVNKWCALLLKSRVCLYEASWRKYHAGTDFVKNCKIPADSLFTVAADAANAVIRNSGFSLHTGTTYSSGRGSYRDLFSSTNVPTEEVMLAISCDEKLSVGYANYYFNVQNVRPSLTRQFMDTYLNNDGTVYSETKTDGTYKTFCEETTDRDLRLNQTIRAWDYTRKNSQGQMVRTTADYNYSLTGYHITKFTLDDVAYDVYGANGNDIPVMRFAEVLLNYAEAKAELGRLTDDDWKLTIGALRRRAGITGGDLDKKPTAVDKYMQNTYFPNISNPAILEIRRERAIELCLEGFRMKDLKRWACGDLWQKALWTGIYMPALDTPLDMNGDGVYDLYFEDKKPSSQYSQITVRLENPKELISVTGGGKVWNYALKGRLWKNRMYLDPISISDITMNNNLTQNPEY